MEKAVYNLVFPSYCEELTIFSYRFYRHKNYANSLQELNQPIDYSSEFNIQQNTGTHALTAYVQIAASEEKSMLDWSDSGATALLDIILLLSLFTGRDVAVVNKDIKLNEDGILIGDPRSWPYGGILKCSIPYEGKIIDDNAPYEWNIGFEKGLNKIYNLMQSNEWKNTYKGGYFLFLARMAFRADMLEIAFAQCWAVWEHLFSILNSNWMSKEQILRMPAREKISFILVHFGFLDKVEKEQARKIDNELVKTRNRLIHFGKFPDGKFTNHAKVFIRLTESIIAKSLELVPSNVFNTKENLDRFFDGTLEYEEFIP